VVESGTLLRCYTVSVSRVRIPLSPPVSAISEIITMTVYAGEFHASNEYLAGLMGLKKNSISRIISDLHNRGYIQRLGYYCPSSKKTWKRVLKPLVFTDCRIFTLKSDEISSHLFRDKTILDAE
jgi:hypothetical protein